MAIQTEVKLVCDPCRVADKGVQRATKTRRWGVDGQTYEVEVCDHHDERLTKDLDVWLRASRKAGTKPKEVTRNGVKKAVKPAPRPYDKAEFFAWAKENGYTVDESKTPRGPLVRRFLDEKYPVPA